MVGVYVWIAHVFLFLLFLCMFPCGWLAPYYAFSTSAFGVPANDEENLAYESYWYLGYTQTYRANAAFSLYGILKGHRDRGCTRGTFINSFFTRFGAQSFIEAMQLKGHLSWSNNYNDDYFANSGFSSICQRDLGNDYGNNYQAYNDDAYVPSMGETMYPNATSMTLGCSNYQTFQLQTFEGATCDLGRVSGVVDTLDSHNKMLNNMGCVNLYDADYDYVQSDDLYQYNIDDFWDFDHNNGGYDVDESEGNIVPQLSSALDLLKYSQACSVFFSPKACPDPHGLVLRYQELINRATDLRVDDNFVSMIRHHSAVSLLVVLGLLMLWAASILSRRGSKVFNMPRAEPSTPGCIREEGWPQFMLPFVRRLMIVESRICGVCDHVGTLIWSDSQDDDDSVVSSRVGCSSRAMSEILRDDSLSTSRGIDYAASQASYGSAAVAVPPPPPVPAKKQSWFFSFFGASNTAAAAKPAQSSQTPVAPQGTDYIRQDEESQNAGGGVGKSFDDTFGTNYFKEEEEGGPVALAKEPRPSNSTFRRFVALFKQPTGKAGTSAAEATSEPPSSNRDALYAPPVQEQQPTAVAVKEIQPEKVTPIPPQLPLPPASSPVDTDSSVERKSQQEQQNQVSLIPMEETTKPADAQQRQEGTEQPREAQDEVIKPSNTDSSSVASAAEVLSGLRGTLRNSKDREDQQQTVEVDATPVPVAVTPVVQVAVTPEVQVAATPETDGVELSNEPDTTTSYVASTEQEEEEVTDGIIKDDSPPAEAAATSKMTEEKGSSRRPFFKRMMVRKGKDKAHSQP